MLGTIVKCLSGHWLEKRDKKCSPFILANVPSSRCCEATWGAPIITAATLIISPSSCPQQNKLEGTVWMDVDDAKVFKVLDLMDIEKTFSAYQRQQVAHGSAPRSLQPPPLV